MPLNRRDFLRWGATGGALLAYPFCLTRPAWAEKPRLSPQIPRFQQRFRRLPELAPVRSDAITDYYEICVQKSQANILPGMTTEIWGYNGLFPGPTIRRK